MTHRTAARIDANPPAKPCRYHHAPAQLDPSRERVVLDLPNEQLPALLQFLTEALHARKYG